MSLDQRQTDRGGTLSDSAEVAPPITPANIDRKGASDTKYQRLVEEISGDYVIYTHDPDGVITYVSPSIEYVLGFRVDQVLGLNWRDLVGENFVGRDLADRVFEEVAAGKNFYKFTVEMAHADGTTRLVEIQQRPTFAANGNYASMEGIAKDVTEVVRNAQELRRLKDELEHRVAERTTDLIRANEALRKSEERYRTVVDYQTEFIVRWLPGAIYTFVNEAFCRLLDRTSDELIGWCFLHAMHPDDVPDFLATIEKLNFDNPIADFENRLVLPDGSVRWTQWTNQMLFDSAGNVLEYQSVGRDVTALKEAADTIREKETQLAKLSRLATIGELVAGIAHEVHQPLHAAKTFSEAARRNLEMGSPENIETAMDCTKEISDAIARTAKIIRQLREFTSLHAKPFEHLDADEVVRDVSRLLAYETRKHRVKLELRLGGGSATVQGDRVQLEKVCVSLVINAYEAMASKPTEQRRLTISSESDGQCVRIRFCDNGCGVGDADMAKLFDTFYSTKNNGLGMGLALCKSIAELHGGAVSAGQNESSGMTFLLELPQVQQRVRCDATPKESL
ncbi:MAG: PAS domain S-box protein [Planctomycetota bacterium]